MVHYLGNPGPEVGHSPDGCCPPLQAAPAETEREPSQPWAARPGHSDPTSLASTTSHFESAEKTQEAPSALVVAGNE